MRGTFATGGPYLFTHLVATGMVAAWAACLPYSCVLCMVCRYLSWYDMWGYPTLAGLQAFGSPPPAQKRPVANFLLYLCCVCVLSGNFLRFAQRVYLFAWPGVIFLRAGALQASFVLLHPCLHIHASCSPCTVGPWLACVTTCALQSDQIRSAHPTPSLCAFALPCMSIFPLYIAGRNACTYMKRRMIAACIT